MNYTEIQIQPNGWSCTVTAFAMAFQIPLEELLEKIGHDGSKITWPELGDKDIARRGFHYQELIDIGLQLGYHIITIDAAPAFAHNQVPNGILDYLTIDEKVERLTYYLENYKGVLNGTVGFNQAHAIYWDGVQAINPSDGLCSTDLGFINIDRFYIVIRR